MEKKESSNKKKVVITSISVVSLVIIIVLGILGYNWNVQQQKMKEQQNEIVSIYDAFTNTDVREEKFNILKSMQGKYEEYIETKEAFDEVITSYENTIENMKLYFTDEYNKILSKNTISNVNDVTDKELLNSAIVELQDLAKIIADDKEFVCDSNKASSYISDIETLVLSYEKRLAELEKEEILNKYNTAIAENKLDDVSAIKDKEVLNSAIGNLTELLTTVQLDSLLDESEIEKYQTEIETLISSYEARLDEIKKSEKKNNTSNSTTSKTPSASDWRNNISGLRLPDPLWNVKTNSWRWTNVNGTITWMDQYGNLYDAYGNFMANQNDLILGG